jgi:hypothetical protein
MPAAHPAESVPHAVALERHHAAVAMMMIAVIETMIEIGTTIATALIAASDVSVIAPAAQKIATATWRIGTVTTIVSVGTVEIVVRETMSERMAPTAMTVRVCLNNSLTDLQHCLAPGTDGSAERDEPAPAHDDLDTAE